jgi:KAP-like P-loop domain-containing protein
MKMLGDRPARDKDDRLDFKPYADALAELIDNDATETPLTIAITAPWGAGKTSLAEMVAARLERLPRQRGEPPHVVCWFDAWMHDDAPHLGAALAAEVARTAGRARPATRRLLSPLPAAMLTPRQRWRRRTFFGAAVLAISAFAAYRFPGFAALLQPSQTEPDQGVSEYGAHWGWLIAFGALLLPLYAKIMAVGQAAVRYVASPADEAARGVMAEVRQQLGSLIRQATQGERKLVVFVDNLERCRPPRAVEVCEVASQLLGHRDVVTVLIADMSMIAASAEMKYRTLEQSDSKPGPDGEYGRFYLQKIVQLEFEVPPAGPAELKALVADELERPERAGGLRAFRWLVEETRWRLQNVKRAFRSEAETPRLENTTAENVFGFGFAVMLLVGFGLLFAPIPEGYAWALVVLATLGMIATSQLQDRRARAGKKRVEKAYLELRRQGITDSDELRQGLVDRCPGLEPLIEQRLIKHTADDSHLREQAEGAIEELLPPLPRSAKRMFNHLRVLLIVAVGREMLGGSPELTGAHLGRWVVLGQRWPEVGRAVRREPSLVAKLEEAARSSDLDQLLAARGLPVGDHEALDEFLKRQPPLGALAERLVYMRPA